MESRFAAARRATLPLGGLAVLLLVLPSTPSGDHTGELVIASALLAAGSVARLLALRWSGWWAAATAGALIVHATIDPATDAANLRWLPVAAGPLVVAFAAITIGGRDKYWWMALAGGVIAGPLRMLVYDPFLDPTCDGCRHNPVVQAHHPDVAQSLLIVGSGLISATLAAMAVRRARPWPLLVAAAVVAATIWLPGARVLVGVIALAVVTNDAIRVTTSRRRVGHLVRTFRENIDLEQTLRKTLGDPTLGVAYWLDGEGRFAAKTGGAAPGRANGQITTELRMGGTLIAAIHHDPECAEVPALADALDGPARIALENERLTAQLASQAHELQRSRERIVERGDLERQQLERDVHDGAQQHVLALGLDIRTELARTSQDDRKRRVLERCLAETTRALDDLRELSHGLYPPSLQAGGLEPALRALARRSPVDVTIRNIPAERLPARIERAVFALVADATGIARHGLDVEIVRCGTRVEVHIDGTAAPPGQHAADRVAALNGITISDESTIHAVIPCGS